MTEIVMTHFSSTKNDSMSFLRNSRRRFLVGATAGLGALGSLVTSPKEALASPTITSFPAGNDSCGVAIATHLGNGSKRVVIANLADTFVTVRNTSDGSLVGNFDVGD